MRIESGLNSNSYESRNVPVVSAREESKPEKANVLPSRPSGASTFSSTLLSNHLASALWTVEGARKGAVAPGKTEAQADRGEDSRIQMVQAAYREYEIPSAYEEF